MVALKLKMVTLWRKNTLNNCILARYSLIFKGRTVKTCNWELEFNSNAHQNFQNGAAKFDLLFEKILLK